MKNFKFIKRKITEKEINIKAEDEIEALDFFIEIQEKTDILDMDNKLGKSEKFELTIEESDIENADSNEDGNEDSNNDSDELEDDIESLCKECGFCLKF